MLHPNIRYIAVNESTFWTILDLCVTPLDSLLFWSVIDNNFKRKAKIMRASEDGSHQVVLVNNNLKQPSTLTVDLELRRLFWIDEITCELSSVDFEGKDLKIGIIKSTELFTFADYMTVFGDDIFWANYMHSSVLKTNKYGLNGTDIFYQIRADRESVVNAVRVIDSSLQPKSNNRCFRSNCSHLCLPINIDHYHCVCPQNMVVGRSGEDSVCNDHVSLLPLLCQSTLE